MDGDPAVEPELDTFSLYLPLPYRVAFILVLGIWAWGLNLHYLSILKIDVPTLIRYPSRSSSILPPHHLSTYRLATLFTIPLFLSLIIFWTVTHGQSSLVLAWEILPQSYLFLLVIFFILPLQRLSRAGRYRFLTILKRVSVGSISGAQDGKFGDILLADVLTSYAKVLGDLFVSFCMFVSRRHSSTARPDRGCGGQYLVPLIISIPSFIRLRQCLIEFLRVRRSNRKEGGIGSAGWGGQHLANALKYASAFPVILLSALQRGYDASKMGMSETGLFRLWLFFVFVNSFYSFYWDVAKDWDLSLFSSSQERNNPEHEWGLRRYTHFHAKEMYYGAIIIDLMLRCTWSFKLSPHLDHFNDLEGGIFLMELLEVFRRWMWIFFRVETEWVRSNRGVSSDDFLLGQYPNGASASATAGLLGLPDTKSLRNWTTHPHFLDIYNPFAEFRRTYFGLSGETNAARSKVASVTDRKVFKFAHDPVYHDLIRQTGSIKPSFSVPESHIALLNWLNAMTRIAIANPEMFTPDENGAYTICYYGGVCPH